MKKLVQSIVHALYAIPVLGFATRLAAFLASGEMAVAYLIVHIASSGSIWWWRNGGEVVMLYSFLFLVFAAWGAGPLSVDSWIERRRGQPR